MTTISDVAKLAGVSPGTVSRVMNGAANVNPETRLKVQQAIANLGYHPNFQARSLRSKRTDTIALAIPELTNYFWTTVARGVQDSAQASGYHVLICNTYARSNHNLRYLESIYNRVDGMILSRRSEWKVLAGDEADAARQSMNPSEKPVVFVGQSQASAWNVDNVYSDSVSGAFTLTQHLVEAGHRQIAIVSARRSSASASDRVLGYGMALLDAGIPIQPELICWGEYDRNTAERLTHDLLERQPGTTAIVAANNEIAIGVFIALEKRHLAVPGDVAMVCFDDFYPDSRFASFMTVASQSPYDLGVNATQLLLRRLNNDAYQVAQTVVLPVRLVIRQSSGSGTAAPMEAAAVSFERVRGTLIPPLPREKSTALAASVNAAIQITPPVIDGLSLQTEHSRQSQVADVLFRKAQDHPLVPHFEYAINSPLPYRFVLEREPNTEYVQQTELVTPEDQVEFASRCGLCAIPCRFPYQVAADQIDLRKALDSDALSIDFPLFTEQIDFFDRYVRAARNTKVGIAADFRAIVADSLNLFENYRAASGEMQASVLQKIAEALFYYQSKVVQLICDRFGSEIAFVLFSDELADENGLRLPQDVFNAVFLTPMKQLILPVKEHGLPAVLYTPGKVDTLIPVLEDIGFDGVYLAQPEVNDLQVIGTAAAKSISVMGGIPGALLSGGREGDIEAEVTQLVSRFAADGHYIAGVGPVIDHTVSIQNFFTYVRAVTAATAKYS